MKKILFLIFLVSSCSHQSMRTPSSIIDSSFADAIKEMEQDKLNSLLNGQNCKLKLTELNNQILESVGVEENFDLERPLNIDEAIQIIFNKRLEIKKIIDQKILNNSQSCIEDLTSLFKSLRLVEDFLIEQRSLHADNSPKEYNELIAPAPYLLINPKFKDDFKDINSLVSGDIILNRDQTFSSLLVNYLKGGPGQFTSNTNVYSLPEKREKFYFLTSTFENGPILYQLEDQLDSRYSRALVLRPINLALRNQTLKSYFDQYNFIGKNFEETVAINTAEDIVFHSKEKFQNTKLTNEFGLNFKNKKEFLADDLQFSPEYEIVAEWRNPRKMEEVRLKDQIFKFISGKIKNENYQFDFNKLNNIDKNLWKFKRSANVKKNNFILNNDQIDSLSNLEYVLETLFKELESKSIDTDHELSLKEINDLLVDILNEDKESERSKIYRYFHP